MQLLHILHPALPFATHRFVRVLVIFCFLLDNGEIYDIKQLLSI